MGRQLPIDQRIFVCKCYYKYESARRVRAEFIRKFPGQLPPSRSSIHFLVNKFENTGSVLNQKHTRRRTVLTDGKLDEIVATLQGSPRKSLPKLAQEVGVSLTSAHRATKLLKLKHDVSSISYEKEDADDPAPSLDMNVKEEPQSPCESKGLLVQKAGCKSSSKVLARKEGRTAELAPIAEVIVKQEPGLP